ncbi:MAG: hypothetical protein J7501_12755, partial [Bdellovibrio sp.]|nr:hypothetical protein [Bdellovibrio sp.]
RVSAGIYQIKYQTYRDEEGMVEVTLTIDTTEVFIADRKQREQCGNNFCDGQINANISIKETSVPVK